MYIPSPIGTHAEGQPCYAVQQHGRFRPLEANAHAKGRNCRDPADSQGDDHGEAAERHDVIAQYSNDRLFQLRVVRRDALLEVAAALKEMPPAYGNAEAQRASKN